MHRPCYSGRQPAHQPCSLKTEAGDVTLIAVRRAYVLADKHAFSVWSPLDLNKGSIASRAACAVAKRQPGKTDREDEGEQAAGRPEVGGTGGDVGRGGPPADHTHRPRRGGVE